MGDNNPKRRSRKNSEVAELKAFDDRLFRAICLNCKEIMTFPNMILGLQMLREMKWRCMKCEIVPLTSSPVSLRKKMDNKK